MALIKTAFVEAGIPVEAVNEFIEHRKKLKKPLTQGSLERNMREAWKAKSIGFTPEAAIYETIDAGWQGINVKWLVSRLESKKEEPTPTTNRSTRDLSPSDMFDTSWAM